MSSISKLITSLSSRLDDLNRSKIGTEQAIALFKSLSKEQRHRDRDRGGLSDMRSVDSLSLDVDRHMHDMNKELLNMKKDYEENIKKLKDYFDETLDFALHKSMDDGKAWPLSFVILFNVSYLSFLFLS